MFQQVDIPLNGKLIITSTNTNTYTAMLEVLLGYNEGAKNLFLTVEPCKKKSQQRKWIWWQWMTDDSSIDYRIHIIEAQFCVPHVKLSDKKYRNIQQSLLATPACYPIKRLVMKTDSVAQGIPSLN